MNVIFLAPHYPAEMIQFTKGLAAIGVNVIGVGEPPLSSVPESVQRILTSYIEVPSFTDEDRLLQSIKSQIGDLQIHRIEALWEPLVMTAANLRKSLGVPGMTPEVVRGFRDKSVMKARLKAAGIRVPKFAQVDTIAAAKAAIREIGFPCIIKPVAGAGSNDTYRLNHPQDFDDIVPALKHLPVVSIEEFIDGEEFTYDTICIDGRPVFENVTQYHPRPLIRRQNEWINPAQMTFADPFRAELRGGIEMGRKVLEVLGMERGFTHMEWYRTQSGEVVFGEIGCRPGGAHLVDQMNFSNDIDLFSEWARAVCFGEFRGIPHRKYHSAIIYKRAQGEGRIDRIEGLDALQAFCGSGLVAAHLSPIGAERKNWAATVVGDGYLIVRDPDYDRCLEMMNAAVTDLRMYAS